MEDTDTDIDIDVDVDVNKQVNQYRRYFLL